MQRRRHLAKRIELKTQAKWVKAVDVIQFADHFGRGTGVVGRCGGVGRTDIWRRFGVAGRTDTVLAEEEDDVRHCQQSPI